MQITFNSVPKDLQGLVDKGVSYNVKHIVEDRLVLSNQVIVLVDEAEHYTVSYPPIVEGHLTATFDNVTGELVDVKEDRSHHSFASVDINTGLITLTYLGVIEDSDYSQVHVQLMYAEDMRDRLRGLGVWG